MKTFVEVFIEHINKLIINQQLHNNVFISFLKKRQNSSHLELTFTNKQNLNDFKNALI